MPHRRSPQGLPRPRSWDGSPDDGRRPDDGVPVLSVSDRPSPPSRASLRWSLLVIAAVLAVVAFWVSTSDIDTAAGSTTTVATTLTPALAAATPQSTSTTMPPATLGELVPNLDVHWIGVAYVDDDGGLHQAIWGIASTTPAIDGTASSRVRFAEPIWARGSLSADGRVLAYGDDITGLVVRNATVAGGVANWSWHPEHQSLAWISQVLGTDTSALYVLDLTPRSEPRLTTREVLRFPSGSPYTLWSTQAYTSTGFVVSGSMWDPTQGDGSITLVLDESGDVLDVLAAAAVDAGSNGMALFHSDVVQGPIPEMVEELASDLAPDVPVRAIEPGWWLRRSTGELQPVSLDSPGPDSAHSGGTGHGEMTLLSPSGDAVVAFHRFGPSRYTVARTPISPDGTTAHVEVDSGGQVRPLGLSRDGRWAILGGDHLVLVDLDTETSHQLPFDLGTIVAVGF